MLLDICEYGVTYLFQYLKLKRKMNLIYATPQSFISFVEKVLPFVLIYDA